MGTISSVNSNVTHILVTSTRQLTSNEDSESNNMINDNNNNGRSKNNK